MSIEVGRMMQHSKQENLSAAERERLVWDATRRYARGEMSPKDFQKAEQQYTPDYQAAISGLSGAYIERPSNGADKG
jgi:hypothetical protein